jgi:hypothetical protein
MPIAGRPVVGSIQIAHAFVPATPVPREWISRVWREELALAVKVRHASARTSVLVPNLSETGKERT